MADLSRRPLGRIPAASDREQPNGTARQLAALTYAGLAFGIVTGPLVSRGLAASGRGLLAGALTYAALAGLVTTLGLPNAVGLEVISNGRQPSQVLRSAAIISLLLTPLSLCLGVVMVTTLPVFSSAGPLTRLGLVVQFSSLGIGTYNGCLQGVLLARGRLKDLAVLRLLPFIGNALFVIVTFSCHRLSVGGLLLSNFILALVGMYSAKVLVGVRLERGYSAVSLLRIGLKSLVGSAANYANARLDQAVMLPLVGPSALGQYAVAVSVSQLPLGAAQALSSRTFGLLARSGSVAEKQRQGERQMNITLMYASLACLALSIVSPLLGKIYGPGFGDSGFLLLLLLPGAVALSATATGNAIAVSRGHVGITSWTEVISLVVTVAGLALFLPRYGAAAAGVVSSLAYSSAALVLYGYLRRRQLVTGGHLLEDAVDSLRFLTIYVTRNR